MGKDNQETQVQVVQNNQQTQEVNVANQTLSDTVGGLLDVLKAQAANPASYYPITVIADTGTNNASQVPQNSNYTNTEANALLSLMYLQTARGQQDTSKQDLPDNMITIFIAAAIVIVVVMVMRRK